MNNKTLIIEAIDNFEMYSLNQKEILKVIVSTAVNNLASISASYISSVTNISEPNVYSNLRKLQKDNAIKKTRTAGTKLDTFELNHEKLDYILKLHQNKKAMEESMSKNI